MIQMKFCIQSDLFTKTKKIQFCKNHEKNLEVLYSITKQSIISKEKISLDQLMVTCCFHIVKWIRESRTILIEQDRLMRKLSKHQSIVQVLKDLKKISIEAKIDDIPKKTLIFSPNFTYYVPNLTKQPVLR